MAEQLFQIGVKGLIRNSEGEIFMLHLPDWGRIQAHWDLPGGRMDPGETFLETLKRELQEEIGVTFSKTPTQLLGMQTNISIPVGNDFIPLVFMIYIVDIEDTSKIKLATDVREDKMGWFSPKEAAKLMKYKFTPEFCNLVQNLK